MFREILILLGLLCIIAAVIGGGLKVKKICDVPVITSYTRQILLAAVGSAIVLVAVLTLSDAAPGEVVMTTTSSSPTDSRRPPVDIPPSPGGTPSQGGTGPETTSTTGRPRVTTSTTVKPPDTTSTTVRPPDSTSSTATPPDTVITSGPTQPTSTSNQATFMFTSDDPQASFECSRDALPYFACTSPHTETDFGDNVHNFFVRARNAAGVDPTPAGYKWRVDTT